MNAIKRKAIFVYEAARIHAMEIEAPIVPAPWIEREGEFRTQFVELISELVAGTKAFRDPERAHDSWVEQYLQDGWKYGKRYSQREKTHPDLVPFADLDPREKIKDAVFMALVEIAKRYIW